MPEGLLPNGKFAPNNKLAVHGGNPWISQIQKFQKTVLNSVTQKELRAVMKAMIREACAGDVNAAKLILERTCGKLPPDTQITMTNVSQGSITINIKQDEDD